MVEMLGLSKIRGDIVSGGARSMALEPHTLKYPPDRPSAGYSVPRGDHFSCQIPWRRESLLQVCADDHALIPEENPGSGHELEIIFLVQRLSSVHEGICRARVLPRILGKRSALDQGGKAKKRPITGSWWDFLPAVVMAGPA